MSIPLIQIAKSLVIFPASITPTHAASKLSVNLLSSGLLSNLALCAKPLVQANIEAKTEVQSSTNEAIMFQWLA